jgi:septum formation topological specificity factor MinE
LPDRCAARQHFFISQRKASAAEAAARAHLVLAEMRQREVELEQQTP